MKRLLLVLTVLLSISTVCLASFPIHDIIEPISSAKTDTAAWGISSFIFGLLGFINPLFGVPAIIFGALGFKKKLRGLAIAGFVLGVIEILIVSLAIVLILSVFSKIKGQINS